MQQSDLGNLWYSILDKLGFPIWVAESITIALACLALIFIWYYCVKGIFIAKIESRDVRRNDNERKKLHESKTKSEQKFK